MPWSFSDSVEAKNESEARKKFNKLFKEKYSYLEITRGQFKATFKSPTKQFPQTWRVSYTSRKRRSK